MSFPPGFRRASAPVKQSGVGETLVRRNPLVYPRARAWFARLERALAVAARTPYGRAAGAGGTLESWPLLEPAAVRARPRDFLRAGMWTIRSSTGGTTGIPLPLARSAGSVAFEQAALDHLLDARGVDPRRARVAVLRGDDVKAPDDRTPPFWVSRMGGRRLVFSSNHLSRDTVGEFAAALREFRADYWWVYPTALESLVRLTRDASLTLSVPLIFSSSEVLSPWCREAARAAFSAAILDYYGQAERVALARAGDDGRFAFVPGYSHVEFVPRAGEDGTLYEIVGTSLWNPAMPLVRYRTGDLIRAPRALTPEERERLTLGLAPFGGVIGRDAEILIAPDGARLTGMDHIHRGVDHVVRIQIVHERPAQVQIRVIPDAGFAERDRAALMANARLKIPASMQVELRVVEELERTARGKTPFVIRRAAAPGTAA